MLHFCIENHMTNLFVFLASSYKLLENSLDLFFCAISNGTIQDYYRCEFDELVFLLHSYVLEAIFSINSKVLNDRTFR